MKHWLKYNGLMLLLLLILHPDQSKAAECLDSLACDQSVMINDSLDCAVEVADTLMQFTDAINYRNIYDAPYSKSYACPNKRNLTQNTIALFCGGIATLGVLELLPENTTAWNKTKLRNTPFFERWWNHVKKGPVWDHDNWVFNYVLHPYGGAAYYMSARSQGLNTWQSSLYSLGVSTLFWEYGIEAFMEYPSIQDLIITPAVGSIIGEQFYKLKRCIVGNDYYLLGSKFWGHFVAFFLDPVNEFVDCIHPGRRAHSLSITSIVIPHQVSLCVSF